MIDQYKICVKKAEEKLHQCKNACHNPHKRDALPEPEPEASPTNNNYNPENCKKQWYVLDIPYLLMDEC